MKKLFSILKNKTKFNTNKISVKVTILIILITVCVLSITTVGVIMFTKSVVNKGVVGELKAIAETNSQEVQDILTITMTARNTAFPIISTLPTKESHDPDRT